jgi:hypothetical protein
VHTPHLVLRQLHLIALAAPWQRRQPRPGALWWPPCPPHRARRRAVRRTHDAGGGGSSRLAFASLSQPLASRPSARAAKWAHDSVEVNPGAPEARGSVKRHHTAFLIPVVLPVCSTFLSRFPKSAVPVRDALKRRSSQSSAARPSSAPSSREERGARSRQRPPSRTLPTTPSAATLPRRRGMGE